MLPQKVQKNQLITADLLNNIIDSIRECQIQAGVGYSFNRGTGGTTLKINAQGIGGAVTPSPDCPFKISSAISGSLRLVSVGAGSLNGLLPTNYAQCLSTETTPLSGATSSDLYILLDVQTDGKQISSFELAASNSAPTAPTPTTPLAPTSFKYPLAVITTSGTSYSLNPCDQLNAFVYESVRTAKTVQSAVDNAYDIYYVWIVR